MQPLLSITAIILFLPDAIASAETTSKPLFNGQQSRQELQQQGFTPLFDDGSMEKWKLEEWHRGHWEAKGNILAYDGQARHSGKRRADLWTKNDYGDCVVYAEWRLPMEPRLKPHPVVLYNGDFLMQEGNPKARFTRDTMDAGDSGLYFRGSLKCQANIWSQSLGSGEINGYRTDRSMPPEVRRSCIPIKNADHPFGEWNSFLITLVGDEMTVKVNGQTVIPGVSLPGLPASGPIALQHHGDPVEFRQIWIKNYHETNP